MARKLLNGCQQAKGEQSMAMRDADQEKNDAVDDLVRSISQLGRVCAQELDAAARDTVDRTYHSIRDRVSEALSLNEAREQIRARPKAAVVGVFALGVVIGLGRWARLSGPATGLIGLLLEVMRRPVENSVNALVSQNIANKFPSSVIH